MKLPKTMDALAKDVPPTRWNKVLTMTPVVMTVVATLLAGLSTSEMTRAQYFRTHAAQMQSKTGDQWGFFQAKRLRATSLRGTLDLLQAAGELGEFSPAALHAAADRAMRRVERVGATTDELAASLAQGGFGAMPESVRTNIEREAQAARGSSPARRQEAQQIQAALRAIFPAAATQTAADLDAPPPPAWQPTDPKVRATFQAVETGQPEAQVAMLAQRVTERDLADAIASAAEYSRTLDAALQPGGRLIDRTTAALGRLTQLAQGLRATVRVVDAELGEASPWAVPVRVREAARAFVAAGAQLQKEAVQINNDFTAMRLRWTARRYDLEARHNQSTASLYELAIRQDSLRSDRHRQRSQHFFFGMLAAQAAVVVSSLALAVQKRNLLWSFATLAGLLAVSFGAYVYLFV